ncbi:MAG: sortase [Candidatus Paceibacterota bacterium]
MDWDDIPPSKPSYYAHYIKPLVAPFFILFALAFFAINFENVIWIFNKKALEQSIKDRTGELVLDAQGEIGSVVLPTPTTTATSALPAQNPTSNFPSNGEVSKMAIEKINLDKKVEYPATTDTKLMDAALMGKVMHYPGTPLPGEAGSGVFLAHSAPITWGPDYRVFNKIDKLIAGDSIIINYKGIPYVYLVQQSFLINPGDKLPDNPFNEKRAYLLTCWPPNTGKQRMVVEAKLKE